MSLPGKRCLVLSVAIFLAGSAILFGYALTGSRWPFGNTIVMQLELGATNVSLHDGLGTWNGSAANALALWNQHLKRVRFTSVNNSTAVKAGDNGLNNVFFAGNVYGEGFGDDTLAVTVRWTINE